MHDRIEDDAARWALRHPLDLAAERELETWLGEDARHTGALLRAMAVLSQVEEGLVTEHEFDPLHAMMSPARTRRWMVAGIGGAIAAGVAGVVSWPLLTQRHVKTEKGEIRRLPLQDGSAATIDTSSNLRIAMASDTRRVWLDEGQAWFQVAKDRARPFIVTAGDIQARAVGTAFAVSHIGGRVSVRVTEGTVAVWASDAAGDVQILNAGQFAEIAPGDGTLSVGSAPARIEKSLAWRAGDISLENDTLGEAVAQFNRYNKQQLVLIDQSLSDERLVGLFRLDSPAQFAAMLAASLNVVVRSEPGAIRISRKKEQLD